MKSDFNSGAPDLGRSLADLAPGAEGVVDEVIGHDPASRRLLDLGLLAGTHVRVLRRAPLGDPVVYELRGYRLCLRRCDAERVRMSVDTPSGA